MVAISSELSVVDTIYDMVNKRDYIKDIISQLFMVNKTISNKILWSDDPTLPDHLRIIRSMQRNNNFDYTEHGATYVLNILKDYLNLLSPIVKLNFDDICYFKDNYGFINIDWELIPWLTIPFSVSDNISIFDILISDIFKECSKKGYNSLLKEQMIFDFLKTFSQDYIFVMHSSQLFKLSKYTNFQFMDKVLIDDDIIVYACDSVPMNKIFKFKKITSEMDYSIILKIDSICGSNIGAKYKCYINSNNVETIYLGNL